MIAVDVDQSEAHAALCEIASGLLGGLSHEAAVLGQPERVAQREDLAVHSLEVNLLDELPDLLAQGLVVLLHRLRVREGIDAVGDAARLEDVLHGGVERVRPRFLPLLPMGAAAPPSKGHTAGL